MVIERIKYEPTFVTNKFEFYYSSYNNENSYLNYEFDKVKRSLKNFKKEDEFYYWFRLKKEAQILIFNGLDTYAQIYLNNSLILVANNMFRKWEVNVNGILKKDKLLLYS